MNTKRNVFVWNAVAALLQSGHTVLLLMIVSHVGSEEDAGILTIACAVANLVLVGGKYGVRQFQVSDIDGQYKKETYVRSRFITLGAVAAVLFWFLLLRVQNGIYPGRKALTMLCFCIARMVDAMEDVFHGELQKQGKLALASKRIVCRYLLYLTLFMFLFMKHKNLLLSAGISAAASLGAALVLNRGTAKQNSHGEKQSIAAVWALLRECLPLGIMSILSTYLSNAPKYVIDVCLPEDKQAQFNYIFMPVFAFCLLGMFMFQPMIVPYAELWKKGERESFRKLRLRQTLLLEGAIAAALVLSKLAGIPVLSVVFGTSLKGYETHLLALVLGGGFFAMIQYYAMLLTVIRLQKWLLAGFGAASFLCILLGRMVVGQSGLLGISVFFAALTGTLSVYLRTVCAIKEGIR